MRDGRQQRRAELFGLGQQPRLLDVRGQVGPLDGDGDLVDERLKQPPFVRRKGALALLEGDAKQPDHATAGAHRQEQPVGGGQRFRLPARGTRMFPGPFGRAPILQRELVLGRVAGGDLQPPVLLRQQHQRGALQVGCDMVDGGPQHIFKRGGGGDLAAEFVKIGGALRGQPHRQHLALQPRREIADDDGDQQEERRW